jgi:putative flavoprotein involved in K+ transport
MSRRLAERGIDHVVLERGRVGERWRSERWDSLRLLTPRWQSRLPGWGYHGPDPDGFMTRTEVVDFLERYARVYSAPVEYGVSVESLARDGDGFRVRTATGVWRARAVVMATGYCDRPFVPSMANALAPAIAQVVPTRYRNPQQLRDGGVLVVGASSTGIQLAAEIVRSGRRVTLAVGRHTRLPRSYRGRDIMDWFDAAGVLRERTDEVADIRASRAQPSLQLVGSDDHHTLDLDTVQREGVRVVGRMLGAYGRRVYLASDLADSIARADRKMHEQLDRIDRYIEENRLFAEENGRPGRIEAPGSPHRLDLAAEGITTVLWATGYRREYPWLHVPVLDARGEIQHDGGVTRVPGLYALGLNFMRRRNSAFIDGVGDDAEEIAAHVDQLLSHRQLASA